MRLPELVLLLCGAVLCCPQPSQGRSKKSAVDPQLAKLHAAAAAGEVDQVKQLLTAGARSAASLRLSVPPLYPRLSTGGPHTRTPHCRAHYPRGAPRSSARASVPHHLLVSLLSLGLSGPRHGGGRPETAGAFGYTALHVAASSDQPAVVKLLLAVCRPVTPCHFAGFSPGTPRPSPVFACTA